MIESFSSLLQRKFVRDTLTLQIGKVGVLVMGILASVVVPRLLGPVPYGTWQLILSLYGIWQILNLTGLIPSAQTRLAAAVGASDDTEIANVMGFFIRVALMYCAGSTLLLWLARPLLAERFYDGVLTVPTLALWLSLTQPTELVYHLFIITFSSRRQMRSVALLQNANQLILVITTVIAVWISPTPQAIVISRLVYSVITLVMVIAVYQLTRTHALITYPDLRTVLRRLPRAGGTRYWRFGFTNALDKNIANLYTLLPVQMAGIVLGEAAAGYVGLALNAMRQQTFFTSAIMDNMQAVVPQAVGRGDYGRLWHNFNRVLIVLAIGGGGFYVLFALAAPFVVPILYGADWVPTIRLLQTFAVFGAVNTVGSVFGPLYRAFDFVRGAFLIKLGALIVLLPVGYSLLLRYGTLGGVWLINLLFIVTVLLTALMTLPELRQRARAQQDRQ